MGSKSSLAICCHANCEWLLTRNVHAEWNMSHRFNKEKARVNYFSSVIHRLDCRLSLWQTERKTLPHLFSNYRDWFASISIALLKRIKLWTRYEIIYTNDRDARWQITETRVGIGRVFTFHDIFHLTNCHLAVSRIYRRSTRVHHCINSSFLNVAANQQNDVQRRLICVVTPI